MNPNTVQMPSHHLTQPLSLDTAVQGDCVDPPLPRGRGNPFRPCTNTWTLSLQ
jgi:hypothetical protein